jgi:hypothetical protein
LWEQSVNETWYIALSLVADEALPLFWRLSYGASFWWMPGRAELLPDGFTDQPFTYGEVTSVMLFDTVRCADRVFACDLTSMARRLSGVTGLLVTELKDISCPPAKPPNRALKLTVQ